MSEPAEQSLPGTREPPPGPDERADEADGTDGAEQGQVSEGPSSFGNPETGIGGADAVPDTPDINPGTPEPIRHTARD